MMCNVLQNVLKGNCVSVESETIDHRTCIYVNIIYRL